MKKSFRVLIMIVLLVFVSYSLTGCMPLRITSNLVTGNGIVETREMNIEKPLMGVATRGAIDIILDSTLQDKLILEGESNLLDFVEINQNSQGVLEIGFKNGTSISCSRNITVYTPIINGGLLETSSVGSIQQKGNEVLAGDSFDLRVSSTGSIKVTIETKELKVSNSSTGTITVAGGADKSDIALSSTGYFEGFDFKIIDANISISGPGGANVNVSGEFHTTISGPGNVVYDGNPQKIYSDSSGPGKLLQR